MSDTLAPESIKDLVSVVIPNWNGKRFLTGVLDSLAKQSYKQVEVIVVDNGSHDGSVEFIRENYPFVRLALYEKNTGFAVAVNRGIRESKGEYIALINNDTVLEDEFIAELVKGMHEHPECGSL
ncbi:MAG: glycosyltransferase family 2 protein, partial [Cyanobacteria bacterium PR.023]|nr:glycosyltransferase family 2 protein [Cyanobacteria bacterium PR.023]